MSTDKLTSSGIPTVIDDPAIPPMWFVVPEGFHALPVDADPDNRISAATDFTRELFPEGDAHLWESAAPFYAGLTEVFADSGLAYSAMGVFGDDNGGVVHFSFTVGAIASPYATSEEAADAIGRSLGRDQGNDSRRITLPCGPAVSNISVREITIGAELTSTGDETKLLTGQIQVFVPFPDAAFIVVFTLDTAAMEYWGEICDLMAAVLETVSFAPAPAPRAAVG
ncbi:hypothetical protein ABTX60_23425 [Streptomyces sp. NPDC126510]|uniref:hypothetical protein n=1 Tax=Streptomyces sp. NPDC126510 TaxID=3155317 RepID=UPI00331E3CCA